MTGRTWLVVRRSKKIPGGYKIVRAGLTEQQAKDWAASYKTPHQPMSYERIVEIRTAALCPDHGPSHLAIERRYVTAWRSTVPDRELYLAERAPGMHVQLIDGAHSEPEGVARAMKLHQTIFGRSGEFVMVEIHPLPESDPEINEEAAEACRAMVSGGDIGV
jgi:hypothetical protein